MLIPQQKILYFSFFNGGRRKFSISNLLLTSLLAETDGPAELSAGGLWARGEEGLSSSGISLVTTSTVSTGWICVSGDNNNNNKKHDMIS